MITEERLQELLLLSGFDQQTLLLVRWLLRRSILQPVDIKHILSDVQDYKEHIADLVCDALGSRRPMGITLHPRAVPQMLDILISLGEKLT